jgi:hypothetical protein
MLCNQIKSQLINKFEMAPKKTKAKKPKVLKKSKRATKMKAVKKPEPLRGWQIGRKYVEGRIELKDLSKTELKRFEKYVSGQDKAHPSTLKEYQLLSEGNKILRDFLINHRELTPQQHSIFSYWLANIDKESPSYRIYTDFINRPEFVDVLSLAPSNFDTPAVKSIQSISRTFPFLKQVLPPNTNCFSAQTHNETYPQMTSKSEMHIRVYSAFPVSNSVVDLTWLAGKKNKYKLDKKDFAEIQQSVPDNAFMANDTLWYSDVTKAEIGQVLNECGTQRFVLFVVSTISADNADDWSHANALFIDKKLKTIEWLEPNGSVTIDEFSAGVVPWIKEFMLPHLGDNYMILTPEEVCPRYVERAEPLKARKGGYCVAWSTVLLHSRIANPDYFTVECQELLNRRHSPEALLGLIRRYINWMDALTAEIKDPQTKQYEAQFSARQQEFIRGQQK